MNLRKLTTSALLLLTPLVVTACGTLPGMRVGPEATEQRDISAVSAVSLDGIGRVVVSVGDEPSLSVTAGERVMNRIVSEVRGDTLVLDIDGPTWGDPGDITYELVLPAVEEIRVGGAGDVDADFSGARTVTVHIDGAGDVIGRGVDAENVEVEIRGAGDVELVGSAERENVLIAGAGEFRGLGLETPEADVAVDGAGEAAVHVTRSLRASVSGAGEISYTGGADVTSEISGVGDVLAR